MKLCTYPVLLELINSNRKFLGDLFQNITQVFQTIIFIFVFPFLINISFFKNENLDTQKLNIVVFMEEGGKKEIERKRKLPCHRSLEYAGCTPCTEVTPLPKNRGVLSRGLNSIWWWGFSSRDLGSVEYPFIAVTSTSTLTWVW